MKPWEPSSYLQPLSAEGSILCQLELLDGTHDVTLPPLYVSDLVHKRALPSSLHPSLSTPLPHPPKQWGTSTQPFPVPWKESDLSGHRLFTCSHLGFRPQTHVSHYVNIFQRSPGGFLDALPTGQVLEGRPPTPISQRELGKGLLQQSSHSLQRNLLTNPITESILLPSYLCAALMRLRPPSLDSWITIVNMYMRDPLIQPIFWYLSD